MKLSLNKAAQTYKVSKSTLSEALNTGRLSASKDARGRWEIDPSEMDRVFPLNRAEPQLSRTPNAAPNTEANTENRIENARLQAALDAAEARLSDMQETVTDLRSRLDQEGADRRAAQARLEDFQDRLTPAPAPEAQKSPSGGFWSFFGGKGRAGA
ncbi:hypothetical protein I8N54_20090 (plasmid) [Pelagovum pacificum]|nr:hypothetical protein I8N54_20090 [Pelagovum pacificum]